MICIFFGFDNLFELWVLQCSFNEIDMAIAVLGCVFNIDARPKSFETYVLDRSFI